MKRIWAGLLGIALLFSSASAEPDIVFFSYNAEDTFVNSVVSQVEQLAQGRANLTVLDGANNQNVQNDQLKTQLAAGVDAVIMNPVDRTTSVFLIELAKRYATPIVFINREPLYEDLCKYSHAYYVGTDPKELGTLCGQLVAGYFTAHPEADLNGDGVIQYILLKGQLGHQDAELRTFFSIKAIKDAGFATEKLDERVGNWERSQGQEIMAAFLNEYGRSIECVIANNDDMALGAIDTLKAAGYFTGQRFLPVFGVDATQQALEAMRQGTLAGTVLNDASEQGKAAFELAMLLAEGKPTAQYAYTLTDNKYVWIPGCAIPAEKAAK